MAPNSEWEAAYRDVIARGRERVGEPPTPEELVAYSLGELPEDQAARVRESLTYYPDLAKALSEGAEPSEDEVPYLSQQQLASDWRSLQQRMHPAAASAKIASKVSPIRIWQWATAAALLLFALTGGLYLRSRSTIATLQGELGRPRANVERILLFDASSRGPGSRKPVLLSESTEFVVIALTLVDETRNNDRFRVEIRDLDAKPSTVIWKSPIRRASDGTFVIGVPRHFLKSHRYRISLYASGRDEPIASYALPLATTPNTH